MKIDFFIDKPIIISCEAQLLTSKGTLHVGLPTTDKWEKKP